MSGWILVVLVSLTGMLLSVGVAVLLLRRARYRGAPAAGCAAAAYPTRSPTLRSRTALLLVLLMLADIALTAGLSIYFQRENIRQAQLLQREGVVARATVVAKEIEEDDEGDETYYVTYTFRSNPGRPQEREITCRDSVSEMLYGQIEPGGTIEVIYARSEPTVVRLTAGYRPGAIDWLPAGLGAAIGLPSVGALVWFFSLYRRATRLDEQGTPGLAEVLDKYEVAGSDSTSRYIVFRLPGGTPFRCSVGKPHYDRLQVGAQVEVLYLPDDPRIFRLV